MSSVEAKNPEALNEVIRQLEVCNSCRYCEGFCAVFPALERRRTFEKADVEFLANLCHGCKACFYACQYAPPHPFAINIPQVLARSRNDTYADYAWPPGAGALFHKNGVWVSLVVASLVAATLLFVGWMQAPGVLLGAHTGPGAFYAVIPWNVMAGLAGVTSLYALLALVMGLIRFWKGSTRRGPIPIGAPQPLAQALGDVLTLRNLGNDGAGCNNTDESFSDARRRLHHAMFYGFLLCFAATCVATVYDHFLHLPAPYPLLSLPVILGTIGGIGLATGTIGLFALKFVSDKEPTATELLGADAALLLLLAAVALTGLLLLAVRSTPAMGVTLAIHLGLILALFVVLPYSKFVHAAYRAAALLRDRQERHRVETLAKS